MALHASWDTLRDFLFGDQFQIYGYVELSTPMTQSLLYKSYSIMPKAAINIRSIENFLDVHFVEALP